MGGSISKSVCLSEGTESSQVTQSPIGGIDGILLVKMAARAPPPYALYLQEAAVATLRLIAVAEVSA